MKYNPAFDVTRAFAVILVFFFHTTYGRLPGGGIGVDIFFVLSGFLITSILKNEWESTGEISFRDFYYRRVLRLAPALIIGIILANICWNNVQIRPESDRMIANLSAVFYFANLVPGYVINTFSHMWSLAVEEQFYMVWPIILISTKFRLQPMIILFLITTAIGFLPMPVYASDQFVIDSLFLPFKAPALILGSILAITPTRLNGKLALAIGSAAIILCSFYPQHSIIVNMASVLLIIGAIKTKFGLWNFKPLIWLGKRSYGFYLYHFPISQYLEGWRELHNPLNFVVVLFCKLLFTIVLSHLSYELVEKYFLKKKHLPVKTQISPRLS